MTQTIHIMIMLALQPGTASIFAADIPDIVQTKKMQSTWILLKVQMLPYVDAGVYQYYQFPYVKNQGWYDMNKTSGLDASLCFAGSKGHRYPFSGGCNTDKSCACNPPQQIAHEREIRSHAASSLLTEIKRILPQYL